MQNSVALVDLQDYSPSLQQLTTWLEQHDTLYLFHAFNQNPFDLQALTDLSIWINSGQVVILDLPQDTPPEYQYAMLAGQLLAILEPTQQVLLLSARPSAQQLFKLLQASACHCQWQALEATESGVVATAHSVEERWGQRVLHALDILLKPVQSHRLYVDYVPLALQQRLRQASQQQSSLKAAETQAAPQLTQIEQVTPADVTTVRHSQVLDEESVGMLEEVMDADDLNHSESSLHFHASDQIHFELLRQLQQKQAVMPKDIYLLKDLLTEVFPDADASLIIKALIKRGYIYWNGHEVTYSHEMYLN